MTEMYSKLKGGLCNLVYKDCIPPSVIAKESMEEFRMTTKRYYTHKHSLKENKVHDKICHQFMNIDETVEHMNNEYLKYKQ